MTRPDSQLDRRQFLLSWLPFFFYRGKVDLSGVRFRVLRRGDGSRRFLVIHGDEDTARDVLTRYMQAKDTPARGIAYIVTGKTREVEIKGLRIDPNRMFSRGGAERSILGLNPNVDSGKVAMALDYLDHERENLLKHLTPGLGSRLFAMHNNRDYSVNNELAASDQTSIKEPAEPRDFFLCTDPKDYEILKQSPYNVVLQSKPEPDDGSLSRLAARRSFRYINLECAIGQFEAQMERVKWLDSHLP